jgi:hypothetical protein
MPKETERAWKTETTGERKGPLRPLDQYPVTPLHSGGAGAPHLLCSIALAQAAVRSARSLVTGVRLLVLLHGLLACSQRALPSFKQADA